MEPLSNGWRSPKFEETKRDHQCMKAPTFLEKLFFNFCFDDYGCRTLRNILISLSHVQLVIESFMREHWNKNLEVSGG